MSDVRQAYLDFVKEFLTAQIPNMGETEIRRILMDVFSTDFMATRRLIRQMRDIKIKTDGACWLQSHDDEYELSMEDLDLAIKEMGLE